MQVGRWFECFICQRIVSRNAKGQGEFLCCLPFLREESPTFDDGGLALHSLRLLSRRSHARAFKQCCERYFFSSNFLLVFYWPWKSGNDGTS